MERNLVVLALGGNMILQRRQKGTFEEQMANVSKAAEVIADLYDLDYKIVLTSGNGPQVGNILAQQDYEDTPVMPLYVCGAMSQGQIGYFLMAGIEREFRNRGKNVKVVSICTRVLLDKDDSGFKNPTKPIGRFYTKEQAEVFNKEGRGPYLDDAGRGYRLFVASPHPIEIIEKEEILKITETGTLVYCVGGGGIPVILNEDGILEGAMAVIDKDRASAVLAAQIGARILIIITDVPNAFINYNKENQETIGEINLALAMNYYAEGHFIKGSMGPKIESAIKFVKETQGLAIITNPENAIKALHGEAGTRITP